LGVARRNGEQEDSDQESHGKFTSVLLWRRPPRHAMARRVVKLSKGSKIR
jgi:hypothetical protein